MKKRRTTFSIAGYWNKLIRKFYALNDKIRNIIFNGNASNHEVNILLGRLNKIYLKLSKMQSKVGLKIAGSALALMLATTSINAQDFKFQGYLSNNESQPISTPFLAIPEFADLDNDGDLDLYVASYSPYIQIYENDGNNNFNLIGNLQNNQGNKFAEMYAFFDFGDIDNDGDLDIVTLNDYEYLFLYENNGENYFNFVDTLRDENSEPIFAGDIPFPEFADIDDDGDMDLFIGNIDGYIYNFLNDGEGNFTANGFLQADGVDISFGEIIYPKFSDLDNDGDMDLYAGTYYSYILFFENTDGEFSFVDSLEVDGGNQFGTDVYLSFHAFADLDNDGDLDIYAGQTDDYYNGSILFFENDGDNTFTSGDYVEATNTPISFEYFTSPTIADIDQDGNLELFIGTYDGSLLQFNQTNAFEFGFDSELQADGEIINAELPVADYADIDGDGTVEMLVGEQDGYILRFDIDLNGDYSFVDTLTDINNNKLMIGNFGSISFADLGNGLSLFTGGDNFMLEYSVANGEFTFVDTLRTSDNNAIDLLAPSPKFADIDGDSELELLVGDYFGYITIFENDGNNNFDITDTLEADGQKIKISYLSRFDIADIDDDGDLDLVFGGFEYGYGGYMTKVKFYRNDEIVLSDKIIESGKLNIYPNPTNGQFTISETKGFDVDIFDVSGRKIRSFTNVQENKLEIDFSSENAGIYIVNLSNENETKTAKVIVQ